MSFQKTFKALSDPTRRRILELLRNGPKTAGELGAAFDMTGATVSHHLATLKEAGLISDEKTGKFIYYQLDTTVVQDIMAWMTDLTEGYNHEEE